MRVSHTVMAVAGLAALAGPLATTALAQMSPNGWIIEVEDPILAPPGHSSGLPQMTTVKVFAKFDNDVDYAFAAGIFDFISSEAGGWSLNTLVAPWDADGTDPGTLFPAGAEDVTPGQVHFPPVILGDSSNPALVWTIKYTATDFTPRFIDLETLTSRFDLYIGAATPESRTLDTAMLMEGTGRIQIIPAPGALACLGLAGTMLVRRRR